jgi:hypothetical protein
MPTATLCHCQTQAILPGQSLDALRQQEQEQAARLQQQGAVSVLTAYDPRQWQLLRYRPGVANRTSGSRQRTARVTGLAMWPPAPECAASPSARRVSADDSLCRFV